MQPSSPPERRDHVSFPKISHLSYKNEKYYFFFSNRRVLSKSVFFPPYVYTDWLVCVQRARPHANLSTHVFLRTLPLLSDSGCTTERLASRTQTLESRRYVFITFRMYTLLSDNSNAVDRWEVCDGGHTHNGVWRRLDYNVRSRRVTILLLTY